MVLFLIHQILVNLEKTCYTHYIYIIISYNDYSSLTYIFCLSKSYNLLNIYLYRMSRARKPHSATGEYTPYIKHKSFDQAYIILGHGADSDRIIRVPDNCMVITLALPGDLISGDDLHPRITRMMNMSMKVLLNPLAHPKKIFDAFGALTYYLPGTECPNFSYQLAAMVPNEDEDLSAILPGSGLVNIANMQERLVRSNLIHIIGKTYKIPSLEDVKINIARLYGYSSYPEPKNILKLLENPSIDEIGKLRLEIETPTPLSIDDLKLTIKSKMTPEKMKSYVYQHGLSIVYNSAMIRINQQEIFTDIFPGISAIYYNFVCREKGLKDTKFYHNTITKLLRPTGLSHIPTKREVRNDTNHVPLLGKFRELHMKRLNNTMNRRRQARNYYTSNFYKQKRLAPYSSVQRNYNETMQRHGYNVLRSANRAYINRLEKQLDERNQFIKDFELGIERTAPSKHSSKRSGKHSSKRDVKHSTRRHSAH